MIIKTEGLTWKIMFGFSPCKWPFCEFGIPQLCAETVDFHPRQKCHEMRIWWGNGYHFINFLRHTICDTCHSFVRQEGVNLCQLGPCSCILNLCSSALASVKQTHRAGNQVYNPWKYTTTTTLLMRGKSLLCLIIAILSINPFDQC